jgi:transcriptional regulator with XRE-family HTH domain
MKNNQKSKIDIYVINSVRNFRIKSGLSQADLAHKLQVSEGFIGKIESPKYPTKYNLNHLNKISKIFNCSPKDFLPEKGIEEDD